MKNNISQFHNCAACCACVNACPINAISIKQGEMFYEIDVNDQQCVSCGKCVSVCPVNMPEQSQNILAGYAGAVSDDYILANSSSGGAFRAIAELVLEEKGVVFGAVYSEDAHSVLFSNSDHTDLIRIQKSKYVESCVGHSFRDAKKYLDEGRQVLFCGTPCQVAGLKRYLCKEYANLLTCDFSCGGLPSYKMYDDYMNELEKRYGDKVDFVDFRPKNYGWESHSLYVKFKNGHIYSSLATLDPYFRGFLNSLTKRDYCYQCDFADNHYSDIILADFWMYKRNSDIRNHNGLSLVLTNSNKGERIMKTLSQRHSFINIDYDKATYNIKNGHLPNDMVERHMLFLDEYKNKGFEEAIDNFSRIETSFKIKQRIKQIIQRKKYEGSEENRS